MTPDQIIIAAQGICSDYTDSYPTTKSVMYRRMSHRQRALFVLAGQWDREFYGARIVMTPVDGVWDIRGLEGQAGIPPIEVVHDVLIEDPGANAALSAGDRVTIVSANDVAAHFAPRATLRSGVLEAVGTDLDEVVSLDILYSRRPYTITESGTIDGVAGAEVELLEPFDYLLVLDLARDLIRRTIGLEKDARDAVMALLKGDESDILAAFETHVVGHAYAREGRFNG